MSLNDTPSHHMLKDMEPFNDIWFENCFFSALFPIINHFGGSVPAFLNFGICKYQYTDIPPSDNIKFGAAYCKLTTNYMSLQNWNINCNTKTSSNDIVSDIISSISRDMPVILVIDSYFEPIRNDTYMKKHLLHSLNIFGYNNNERKFNIIEHKYSDSRFFEKREIGYNDIEDCYNGLLSGKLASSVNDTFYEYFKLYDKKSSLCNNMSELSIYFKNIIEKRDEISEGLEQIKRFTSDFENIINNKSLLDKNLESLLSALTNIIDKKSIERYCILKVVNKQLEFSNLIDTSISYWSFIRGILSRYKYSSTYNIKAFQSCIEKLTMIYSTEILWYNNVFSIAASGKSWF